MTNSASCGRSVELVQRINALRQQIDPYQLRFANAVWCDTGFPLRDDYLSGIDQSWVHRLSVVTFEASPSKSV